MSRQVEQNPMMSLAVAFAMGYLLATMTRRYRAAVDRGGPTRYVVSGGPAKSDRHSCGGAAGLFSSSQNSTTCSAPALTALQPWSL